jgi:HD superfamily phosphodiesterase
MGLDLVESSRLLAYERLHGLPTRLAHVAGVSARLARAAALVPVDLRPLAAATAWLHDIGYAPSVRRTGFHALDRARFLAAKGYPALVCQLVGHHSGAECEAAARG